jgi:cell wall-associated NlpC family hydrolase
VAQSWLGTPFHHHGRLRGVGVDCVQLLGQILVEVGAITDYSFPPYAMDAKALTRSIVVDYLEARPDFQRVEGNTMPGDILCIRWHRVPHHCGLVIDAETFVHAVPGRGVVQSPIRERLFARRTEAVYRLFQ